METTLELSIYKTKDVFAVPNSSIACIKTDNCKLMIEKIRFELNDIQYMIAQTRLRDINVQKDCERFIKDNLVNGSFTWTIK